MKAVLVIIVFIGIILFLLYDYIPGTSIDKFFDRGETKTVVVTPVPKSYPDTKNTPPLINAEVPKIIICNSFYEAVKKSCEQ